MQDNKTSAKVLAAAKRTALVIPAWNEGKVIEGVLHSILPIFPVVICVNDGSSDNTAARIARTKAILINHPINMGQGAALQTGIEYALRQPDIDYVATFDADGQHNIADVLAMLDIAVNRKDIDVVLGSRFLGTPVDISRFKRFALQFIAFLNRTFGGMNLSDTHNGLRLFTRAAAAHIDITLPGMAHASEIISIIKRNKLRYTEAPVTISYTDYSKSKGQPFVNSINILSEIIIQKLIR